MTGLTRSQQMSRIQKSNTGPERKLRAALWKDGLRYRIHAKTPVGKPDLVFPGKSVAVFIDGCFWHGCPRHYVRPRTQTDYWDQKLRENVERDRFQTLTLEGLGWRVVRVWECEVYEAMEAMVKRIQSACRGEASGQALDWRIVRVEEVDASSGLERRFLEQLRDPSETRREEGRRITTKWRRPSES